MDAGARGLDVADPSPNVPPAAHTSAAQAHARLARGPLNPLFTTRDHRVGSIGHAPIPSNLPATMHSTPHSPLSSSTSGHQDEAPQGSNVLPLRRTPVWTERLSPIEAPQQRSGAA